MTEKPDFEKLRRERDETQNAIIKKLAEEHGFENFHVNFGGGTSECYCACADGGPCEHEFEGWRDVLDDDGDVCGGETVCSRCGMGAMSHSMWTVWE